VCTVCFCGAFRDPAAFELNHVHIPGLVGARCSQLQDIVGRVGIEQSSIAHRHITFMPTVDKQHAVFLHEGERRACQVVNVEQKHRVGMGCGEAAKDKGVVGLSLLMKRHVR
jgi:hypothetical protein